MSDGFETLARADRRELHDVVKDQVALIKSVCRSGKLNWSAAVSFDEIRYLGRSVRPCGCGLFFK
jgi:hypothetical protein